MDSFIWSFRDVRGSKSTPRCGSFFSTPDAILMSLSLKCPPKKISVKLARISGKKINVSTLKQNPDRCAAPLINAYCKDRQQADPIANPKSSHINTQTHEK
jgi:hypothetical protein